MINLSLLLGEAAPGEWVLVHVGFALERISEAEATKTLRWLAEIEIPPRRVNRCRGGRGRVVRSDLANSGG